MNPSTAKTLMTAALVTGLIAGCGTPALAWGDHRLVTREILGDVTWLSKPEFRRIVVTPYTYAETDPSSYSPTFAPIFIDRLVGETTTAREILLRYVDEPDWGMDEDLSVSPFQALAGGSKGYRHQRFYYLGGVVQVGDAHQRAEHFYTMSKQAFAKGDSYWGFRFLARSLHYLEDVGQPLHSRPFRWRHLLTTRFDMDKLKTLSTNHHNYYEAWVASHLAKQQRSGAGNWVEAIRDAGEGEVKSVKDATKALSAYARKNANDLLAASDAYWPRKVKRMDEIVAIDLRLLDPPRPPESWKTLDRITTNALHVTAKVSKGFLAFAYRDAVTQKRTQSPDAGWGGLTDLD